MERPEVEEARVAGAEWTQERGQGMWAEEQGKVLEGAWWVTERLYFA